MQLRTPLWHKIRYKWSCLPHCKTNKNYVSRNNTGSMNIFPAGSCPLTMFSSEVGMCASLILNVLCENIANFTNTNVTRNLLEHSTTLWEVSLSLCTGAPVHHPLLNTAGSQSVTQGNGSDSGDQSLGKGCEWWCIPVSMFATAAAALIWSYSSHQQMWSIAPSHHCSHVPHDMQIPTTIRKISNTSTA